MSVGYLLLVDTRRIITCYMIMILLLQRTSINLVFEQPFFYILLTKEMNDIPLCFIHGHMHFMPLQNLVRICICLISKLLYNMCKWLLVNVVISALYIYGWVVFNFAHWNSDCKIHHFTREHVWKFLMYLSIALYFLRFNLYKLNVLHFMRMNLTKSL